MVHKLSFYRPEPVSSTSIHFERSLISWKFISHNILSNTGRGSKCIVQISRQHEMTYHKVISLRSFEMTDAQSSCHGSAQNIRVEVALHSMIHMAFILCLSRLPSSSTITGRDNLRWLLPSYSSTSFRSNLTRQDAKSTLVANSFIIRCSLFTSLAWRYIFAIHHYSRLHHRPKSHSFRDRKSPQELCQSLRNTGCPSHRECAIRRCLWVFKIFRAVENRTPISEELLYSRAQATTLFITFIDTHKLPLVVLALGMSFDPDITYACHSG